MDLSRTYSENLSIQQQQQQPTIRNRTTNISDIRRQASQDSHNSINSSSSEDLDDICIDHSLVDIDEVVAPTKPHFLDYDAVPPPGFEQNTVEYYSTPIIEGVKINQDPAPLSRQQSQESNKKEMTSNTESSAAGYQFQNEIDYPGEAVKIDKKFEKDGEISDYELAACGFTKRDLTSSQTTAIYQNIIPDQRASRPTSTSVAQSEKSKKKHFLDENPIPPDYMLPFDKDFQREHRSLDRNYDKQNEYVNIQELNSSRLDRKHSLDRDLHPNVENKRVKEPSYTLSRFISSDLTNEPSHKNHSTWPAVMDLKNQSNFSSMPHANESFQKNMGPQVECVYSLLSMLGNHDSIQMSKKFYDLSRTPETSATLRRSGCIPLLVQMMHNDADDGVRKRAAMALHNVVHCHPDDKAGRREAKVLRLIEQIMDYCEFLKMLLQNGGETIADDTDRHPLAAISSLMKVSFDEEHRHAMCQLGALQAIATLVHLNHAAHGPKPEDQCCISLHRYALMALTNLTFGDGNNKALLCSNRDFMEALVAQLHTAPDDLLQVTASVLRNLSWRADSNMKNVLSEIGTVTALAKAAMKNKNENTLKAILSALWNLSAHCSNNKDEFCSVEGALAFLVDMLTYEGPSKTLKIIENAGGILRNVSSHIAVREEHRRILRQRNCLGILLQQLKSESLTVVSNACGTLWNLSARCPEDQKFLWDNGAVPMLRSLINSKHKMIAEGSAAALKNLLNFRPGILNHNSMDPIAKSMGLKELPTLNVRKQRALESELNPNLAETCENIDVVTPPKEKKDFVDDQHVTFKHPVTRLTRSAVVSKSESRDSLMSAKSDSAYEKLRRGSSAPPQSTNSNTLRSQPEYSSSSNTKSLNAFNIPRPLENSVFVDEAPIDYSAKYKERPVEQTESVTVVSPEVIENESLPKIKKEETNYSTYQETDLDQPTDFSLRYAENHAESDDEANIKPEPAPVNRNENEIILILEDSVKCYQTEDTPYVISNAASITDLRNPKPEPEPEPEEVVRVPTTKSKKISMQIPKDHNTNPTVYGSGSYTPEKPIYYCEEGTPGYFSRYESLSSLEESPSTNVGVNQTAKVSKKPEEKEVDVSNIDKEMKKLDINQPSVSPKHSTHKTATNVSVLSPKPSLQQQISAETPSNCSKAPTALNSAQETPLMFSRHSSMDSLVEEESEAMIPDDKSSVVSDFSRLASGIISPSDLPDSPTQSMPHSPRRLSNPIQYPNNKEDAIEGLDRPNVQRQESLPLRSIFEDNFSTFQVENTPAQFSCATSLSNLSLDDEPKITTDSLDKEMLLMVSSPKESNPMPNKIEAVKSLDKFNNSKRESINISENEDEETNDDDLLAAAINSGMNRSITTSKPNTGAALQTANPLLSRSQVVDGNIQPSSVLSSKTINIKDDLVHMSDISSNASDDCMDLFQQCIREGMQKCNTAGVDKKKVSQKTTINAPAPLARTVNRDPISMLRRGGLPPHLPVKDEMNKFIVEDSPCNFSVVSGLSNLTVESEKIGPVKIEKLGLPNPSILQQTPACQTVSTGDKKNLADDSLSSISIESEDDSNLLSQAIAAGCNRPKSNLGLHHNPSQPRPITKLGINKNQFDANDSLSSVDSSDSNEHQAKSLFEQCIQSGMNKSVKNKKERSKPGFISGAVAVSPKRSHLPTLSNSQKTPLQMDRERQRERERKDEQLLKECISTGMTSKAIPNNSHSKSNDNIPNSIKLPTRHVRQVINPIEFGQRLVTGSSAAPQPSNNNRHNQTAMDVLLTAAVQQQLLTQQHNRNQNQPKNGETTSVVVLEQHQNHQLDKNNISFRSATSTAPDVVAHPHQQLLHNNNYQQLFQEVRESPDGTSTEVRSPASTPATVSTPQGLLTVTPHATTAATSPIQSLSLSPIQHISQSTQQQDQCLLIDYKIISDDNHQINTHIEESTATGSNNFNSKLHNSQKSMTSSTDLNILERSNEYPALKTSNIDLIEDHYNGDSFDMEISNEFLVDKINESPSSSLCDEHLAVHPKIQDKHKDPDLMLKSVERLTQELVATAEYLRNNPDCVDFDNVPLSLYAEEKKSKSESNSNSNTNTWNENTCPNDVSFPSVSISAPFIASVIEDETTISESHTGFTDRETKEVVEKTPTNDFPPNDEFGSLGNYLQNNSQPNSLDAETYTLVPASFDESNSTYNGENEQNSSGIQFKVGGEVKLPQMAFSRMNHINSSGAMSFDTSSTMTNSTIIAMEAGKIANNLMNNSMTDSATSLDLDNIRPPSCMESLSMSGCFETAHQSHNPQHLQIPQSPQLSRLRKKSLPAGLMARRALGCNTHLNNVQSGSLESVNSSYNLDNIKPPSLMDELLDSMISVASITSEIVDQSLGTNVTNYETAFSDGDDQTTTLQSCFDGLPTDSNDDSGTPIPSDFSSVESTPRKGFKNHQNVGGVRRMLTPKQKRRIVKDRFKTYTVAADFVLKENFQESLNGNWSNESTAGDEDVLTIEVEDHQSFVAYEERLTENINMVKRTFDEAQNNLYFENEVHNKNVSSPDRSSVERSPSSNKKRRNIDPDRFKTRTIVYSGHIVTENEEVTKVNELESLTSTEDDSEEMSSIRALTKQFKFITQPEISNNVDPRTSIPIKNAFLRMKMLEKEQTAIKIQTLSATIKSTTTTAESDYNSMEFDQTSETESCCDQKHVIRSNINQQQTSDDDEDEEQNVFPKRRSHLASKLGLPRPHIVKPGDKDSGTDLNFSEDPSTPPETMTQPKAIRGRKKPAYVSPYKKSVLSNGTGSNGVANSSCSTRTTSPKSQIGNTVVRANLASKNPDIKKNANVAKHNPKPTTIVAKTHILLNKANLTNKINAMKTGLTKPGFAAKKTVIEKNIHNKKLSSTKQKTTKDTISENTTAPLERQGTFVKDEPTTNEVALPVVGSLPTSPNKNKTINSIKPSNIPKSPAKVFPAGGTATGSPNKNRPFLQKSSSTTSANLVGKLTTKAKLTSGINRFSSKEITSVPTTTTTTTTTQRKSSLISVRKSPTVPTVPQRSNSNAALRTTPSISGLKTENISITQPPSRSNSNLTSTGTTNKISQISSRIAGIWKRVEECKQQSKKNNNTLTKTVSQDSAASTTVSPTHNKAQCKPPSGLPQSTKLIRSSTFDNSPCLNETTNVASPSSIAATIGSNKKLITTKNSHKI